MELLTYLFFLGFFASLIGSLIGLGGGFIIVPVASVLLGVPIKDSIFLALVASLFLSLIHNMKNKVLIKQERERISSLLLFSVVGAVASSFLIAVTAPAIVSLSFAILLIVVSLYNLLFRSTNQVDDKPMQMTQVSNWGARFCFLFSGGLSGFFGIGGGVVNVPALQYFLKYPIHLASKLSFIFIFVSSGAAILTQLQNRRDEINLIPISYLVYLLLGVVLGFLVSQKIKLSNQHLKKIFSIALFIIGLWKIWGQVT